MNTDRSHARVPHRTSRAASHASREARGVPSSVQGSGASRLARSPCNLLPTASIGRLGASQHDPPAPASNAPSFSVVSSVADSVFGGASRRARIAEVLNIICQEIGTISLLGAAGRLHGGHAASGWNGIYLASESPGPARVFREKGGT